MVSIPISVIYIHLKKGWSGKGIRIQKELADKDDEILKFVNSIQNTDIESLKAGNLFIEDKSLKYKLKKPGYDFTLYADRLKLVALKRERELIEDKFLEPEKVFG
jgi:hypothetical protein